VNSIVGHLTFEMREVVDGLPEPDKKGGAGLVAPDTGPPWERMEAPEETDSDDEFSSDETSVSSRKDSSRGNYGGPVPDDDSESESD
jgi:hypothetical protein